MPGVSSGGGTLFAWKSLAVYNESEGRFASFHLDIVSCYSLLRAMVRNVF